MRILFCRYSNSYTFGYIYQIWKRRSNSVSKTSYNNGTLLYQKKSTERSLNLSLPYKQFTFIPIFSPPPYNWSRLRTKLSCTTTGCRLFPGELSVSTDLKGFERCRRCRNRDRDHLQRTKTGLTSFSFVAEKRHFKPTSLVRLKYTLW